MVFIAFFMVCRFVDRELGWLRRGFLSVICNRPIRNRSIRRMSHVPGRHETIRQLTDHGIIALYSNIDYELIDYE